MIDFGLYRFYYFSVGIIIFAICCIMRVVWLTLAVFLVECCLVLLEHLTPLPYFNLQGHWPVPYVERHLGTDVLPKSQLIGFLRANAGESFLRQWKLTGVDRNVKKSHNCAQLTAAYKVSLTRRLRKNALLLLKINSKI